jgi:hypothetical protein
MFNKPLIIAVAIAAFAFIFASVAHACSGLASIKSAVQAKSLSMAMPHDSPCSEETPPDICKFVRDAMLSVKPVGPSLVLPKKLISLPAIPLLDQRLLAPPAVVLTASASFYPVFKLPLSVSYLVLRI